MANPPTILANISGRNRKQPSAKPAPLTADAKKAKGEERERLRAAIDADVDQWFSYTMAKAEELSEKYNKKPRYFLDMFFQGGARLIHERGATAWNAFISKKTEEVNGGVYHFLRAELHADCTMTRGC